MVQVFSCLFLTNDFSSWKTGFGWGCFRILPELTSAIPCGFQKISCQSDHWSLLVLYEDQWNENYLRKFISSDPITPVILYTKTLDKSIAKLKTLTSWFGSPCKKKYEGLFFFVHGKKHRRECLEWWNKPSLHLQVLPCPAVPDTSLVEWDASSPKPRFLSSLLEQLGQEGNLIPNNEANMDMKCRLVMTWDSKLEAMSKVFTNTRILQNFFLKTEWCWPLLGQGGSMDRQNRVQRWNDSQWCFALLCRWKSKQEQRSQSIPEFWLFSRFIRKDFPVLYRPATPTTWRLVLIFRIWDKTSCAISNWPDSLQEIKHRGPSNTDNGAETKSDVDGWTACGYVHSVFQKLAERY